jgi:hypothetical protein
MKKLIVTAALLSAACTPVDTSYHGTVSSPPTPTSQVALAAPTVNAAPITITGTGESVKTVDLQVGGYTVNYRASTTHLIVCPVEASGNDGIAIVNASSQGDSGASGTANFHATGRTTFHVSNTDGTWTLTFAPLS